MRRMLVAMVACVVLAAVLGCAYFPMGPMAKSYKDLQEKMGKPTEIEYSNWNIFGMIGGGKIRVEAEEEGDGD